MTESSLSYFRTLLEEMLTMVAADAETQIAWLKELAKNLDPSAELVDELALDFNDAFVYARQLLDEGEVSRTVYDSLAAVDRKLDLMSGHENTELWCFDALRHRAEWQDVRVLAQKALALYRADQ